MAVTRTDIKRNLELNIDFNPYCRESVIGFKSSDHEDLIDILLQFYCGPSTQPLLPDAGLTGVDDVRFYIGAAEITDFVRTAIVRRLKIRTDAVVTREYRDGGERWLRFLAHFPSVVNDEQIDKDRALLQTTVDAGEIWKHFTRLGDRRMGWSGGLHPINFIFREIRIEPISLQDVWSDFLRSHNRPDSPLAAQASLRFIVSHGPAPSVGDDPKTQHPRGAVRGVCELVYANPLAEILQRVEAKVIVMNERLEQQRITYLNPLKDGFDVTSADLKLQLAEATSRLAEIRSIVEKLP